LLPHLTRYAHSTTVNLWNVIMFLLLMWGQDPCRNIMPHIQLLLRRLLLLQPTTTLGVEACKGGAQARRLPGVHASDRACHSGIAGAAAATQAPMPTDLHTPCCNVQHRMSVVSCIVLIDCCLVRTLSCFGSGTAHMSIFTFVAH
jgi:hypothetical protein